MPTDTYSWYQALEKPFFAPPAWIFGPVWTVLYVLIAVSFGYVFLQAIRGKWSPKHALPFALNLIGNFAFTPLQFGLQNNLLAAIDILFVLVTIVWMIRVSLLHERWIAYAQVPYLLWVSFATLLQLSITYMNF